MPRIRRFAIIAELEGGACHQVLFKDSDQPWLDSFFAQLFPEGIPLLEEPLAIKLEQGRKEDV